MSQFCRRYIFSRTGVIEGVSLRSNCDAIHFFDARSTDISEITVFCNVNPSYPIMSMRPLASFPSMRFVFGQGRVPFGSRGCPIGANSAKGARPLRRLNLL